MPPRRAMAGAWSRSLTRTKPPGKRGDVEQQAGERLRVLDLMEPLSDLGDRPADELELLVVGRSRFPTLGALDGEHVHPFATEAGRRPERRQLAPLAAGQAALLP